MCRSWIRSVVAACALLLPLTAEAADKLTVRLEWAIGGWHAPLYLAKERGYYTQEGIDLEITPGNGSARTVTIVGSKGADIGITDGASLVRGVTQGMKVKMVGALANVSPFCLMVREDSGIKTIQDIKDRHLAFTAGSAQATVWPAVLAFNKIDPSTVSMLNADPGGAVAAVADHRVDGQLAGIDGQPLILADRGIATRTMLFSDLGVPAIGKGFMVHEDLLRDHPDLVTRFLRATRRGMEEAAKTPDEAARIAMAAQDPAARHTFELTLQELKINLALALSPNGKDKPLLWESDKDWEGQLAILKQYGGLETTLPASAFFTNAYLPS